MSRVRSPATITTRVDRILRDVEPREQIAILVAMLAEAVRLTDYGWRDVVAWIRVAMRVGRRS